MAKEQTHIARRIYETGEKARYDECARNILENKMILAHIFRGTVAEVCENSVREICRMIEGTPIIGTVDDDSLPEAITGMDTVDKSNQHGKAELDVLTWLAGLPGGSFRKIIINVEMQVPYRPGYDLVTRGIYYAARRIVRQKYTEFTNSNYGDIKKVYSIWICMDAPKTCRDTVTDHSIRRKDLHGHFEETEHYDLLSVVLIRLGGEPDDYRTGTLQHLLMVLFSEKMTSQEKKQILQQQYDIPMTKRMGKEIDEMCNLSEGIERRGIEKGIKQGRAEGREQGRAEGREEGDLSNIRNLQKSLGITAERAMELLNIPQEKRAEYAPKLS